jgi:hypothetical protein
MAFALNLHREVASNIQISQAEREGRRRLFWTCYIFDRFLACGSKRPSIIADDSVMLRLPGSPQPQGGIADGEFFTSVSAHNYVGQDKAVRSAHPIFIDIVRILGLMNRYLAAGGLKGDSHFPWHSLSNLSKIRQELDGWASDTQETYANLDEIFRQPESTALLLSKLIYHVIHCVIYRPFLPVDLNELSGTSQHQSWQIEATSMCFLHANAIAELADIWKSSTVLEWPAFVGYCICTAGTIHVHGAHYQQRKGEIFSDSAELLSREMRHISELRLLWNGVQHQLDTLQMIYVAHAELVKSIGTNSIRFSPAFNYEDFFDRYQGKLFDGSYLTFNELDFDAPRDG